MVSGINSRRALQLTVHTTGRPVNYIKAEYHPEYRAISRGRARARGPLVRGNPTFAFSTLFLLFVSPPRMMLVMAYKSTLLRRGFTQTASRLNLLNGPIHHLGCFKC